MASQESHRKKQLLYEVIAKHLSVSLLTV